jgi:hypothetical protein
MTTPFLSYAFAPTGAPAGYERTLPDRLADVVNVRDYGAVGDGSADDTISIQNSLDAAFGSYSNPHGWNGRASNKHVFFPPGIYRTTSALKVRWVMAGHILGAGRNSTIIRYTGTVPGGSTHTNVFHADGFKAGLVKGISFEMTGGNDATDNTTCFELTWHQIHDPNEVGTALNDFIDCSFSGATWGMSLGRGFDNWPQGDQTDTTTWYNCVFDDCYVGLQHFEANAISSAFIGGRVSNCANIGLYQASSMLQTIIGTVFENNGNNDVVQFTGEASILLGCHTTSPNFLCAGQSKVAVLGCSQTSSRAGTFCRMVTPASVVIESCYSSNGYLQGHVSAGLAEFYLSDNQFDNPDWSNEGGRIHEFVRSTPFAFSELPTASTWKAEGLTLPISDSLTATWGANVTTGGGSNHVAIRWNGTNWTVIGK